MLDLTGINKSYNVHPVLFIDSFAFESGMYWLKGVNGSGKTTLLKILAGLLPFQGDIALDGISLKKSPVAYRRLCSWAEAEPLFPDFIRGRDLLKLVCEIRSVKRQEIEALVELFEMQNYVSNPIGTYSEGMRKKLSLAIAFLGATPLLLLDEPFITLDTAAIAHLRQMLMDRLKAGATIIMSSHQEQEAESMEAGQTIIVANQTIARHI